MDVTNITAIKSLEQVSRYSTDNPLSATGRDERTQSTQSFDSLLSSAMNMVKQTNDYTNKAEEEEVKFATGESDNLHDLMIAQEKANVSLQYTVAVKNTAIEAYRTLMNMQF